MIRYVIFTLLLISCAKPRPDFSQAYYEIEQANRIEWTIEPNSTRLNKKQVFYITGKKLYGVDVEADNSVEVIEKKSLENGTKLKLVLRVRNLNGESLEEKGKRKILIKSFNFSKEFEISIKNE